MDRHTLEQQLRQVRADLALEIQIVDRQRRIVSGLVQSGQDSASARTALLVFEATQAVYVAEVDRLTKELAARTMGRSAPVSNDLTERVRDFRAGRRP